MRNLRLALPTCLVLSIVSVCNAVIAKPTDQILPMRERAATIDRLTEKRISELLPVLMAEHQIDTWLLISSEYNEDPVLKTMLPATWLSARRTTMLVLHRASDGAVNAYAIAPYKVGNLFERAWDKQAQPDQWQALVALLTQLAPTRIGINQSKEWAHADGLVASEKDKLLAALPDNMKKRLVSAEPLAVAWLERRIPEEVDILKVMGAMAHHIIAEGFSDKVITPGVTTTDDLVWWYRERIRELKLTTWFHPSVSIQRADQKAFDHEDTFTNGSADNLIQRGDLLHVDFGIHYLRLNTDTQQHAYVLRKGETEAPQYLQQALALGNQLQDILTGNFKEGRTGNEVLAKSLQDAKAAGLDPTIYTHPIGYHGHGAGTTIGMWDQQGGVPGDGDYPLHLNTAYSIELNNAVYVEAWQKTIRIMLEEDAYFDESGVWYWSGRQTQLILLGQQP